MASVLVIDDDAAMRRVTRMILERASHRVRVADSAGAGLALHRAEPADLVVLDIVMPDLDGIEAILAFKEEWPTVPILAVSGGGRIDPDERLRDAALMGADATLLKTEFHTKLAARVAALLAS